MQYIKYLFYIQVWEISVIRRNLTSFSLCSARNQHCSVYTVVFAVYEYLGMGGGGGGGRGNSLYSSHRDVRKICVDYKYGCGVLAKIINMDFKFMIFMLTNIDLYANLGYNYNYWPKIILSGSKMGHVSETSAAPHTPTKNVESYPPPPHTQGTTSRSASTTWISYK